MFFAFFKKFSQFSSQFQLFSIFTQFSQIASGGEAGLACVSRQAASVQGFQLEVGGSYQLIPENDSIRKVKILTGKRRNVFVLHYEQLNFFSSNFQNNEESKWKLSNFKGLDLIQKAVCLPLIRVTCSLSWCLKFVWRFSSQSAMLQKDCSSISVLPCIFISEWTTNSFVLSFFHPT